MLKKHLSLKTVVPALTVATLAAPVFAAPIDTTSMTFVSSGCKLIHSSD